MLLFSLPRHAHLGATLERLAGVKPGRFTIDRFSNGELHATVDSPVTGDEAMLLGAVAPPDEDLLATLLLAHTLDRAGASRVVALLPYLGYARHDRDEPGKSLGAAWLGELLRASGVDEIVTVDVHSSRIHQLVPVPLTSLSPAQLFADTLRALGLRDPTVVAPDEGARARCEAVRHAAGIDRPLAWFTKTRTGTGVSHSAFHGAAGAVAVIVDDILDTGGTLISASEALRNAGVREIVIIATHGLFTGTRWERLWSLGVSQIYCTDTTPLPARAASPRIVIVSAVPLLAAWLDTRFTAGAARTGSAAAS